MDYVLTPMNDEHRDAVMAILDHHIATGFAAYPSHSLPPDFWAFMRRMAAGYPAYVVEAGGEVVGYGMLRPLMPPDTLRRTAEIGYFILPQHCGQGLGARLLEQLSADAKTMGVDNIMANVSSLNEGSQRFHLAHGFVEAGRFQRVGRKWDQDFDIVWFQKFI
ncbi:MAG: GNAT family N-acetyltransferase [Desulfarculaceae bacterium]|nr:GNAT family N-acetyltransferase [Desulfarculaceae bacterium]